MNNRSKILLTIGLALSQALGLYPTTDIAYSSVAPTVTTQPSITAGVSVPVRLATDLAGNVYATDPGVGVLKYDSSGKLVLKIVTSKSGGGVAIAQDGTPNARLLVAQGTYVSVIDPATGLELSQFRPLAGPFKYANGIAVDNLNNIFVTDSRDNKVYKFNSAYVQQTPIVTIANARPSGLAYDKWNNRLAVVNSLSGNIKFYNPTTMALLETVGVLNFNDAAYTPPSYPQGPEFSYPQGITFEYTYDNAVPPAITGVNRIYVTETRMANIQVLDGVSPYNRIFDIGSYGFANGNLFVPSDALINQKDSLNKKLIVANGGGTLEVFGIDSSVVFYQLALSTTGDGTITGLTGPSVAANTVVNLTANPNVTSNFTGWTGACAFSNVNTCQFTMTANATVSAIFTLKPFSVNGAYFDDLQAAYNAAPDGSVIKLMTGVLPANNATGIFTANLPKTVTLSGGYNSQYSEPPVAGDTIINGRINVLDGKLIMNNIKNK